jgi:mono/diheme cytochrome c family protein/ketosteroid isomerase-like protein
MKTVITVVLTLAVTIVIGLALVYTGSFSVAADQPHSGLTARLLEAARESSVEHGARRIVVPGDLADAKLIANGAGEYAEMCTGCHLAPGMKETEMRAGLYPRPPDLAASGTPRSAAEQFWIVKHGIKMTGMPAWGPTHDDERLWSMVAFLQKLPGLSESDYRALVESGEGGHHHDEGAGEESGGHSHQHAEKSPAPAAVVALRGEAAAAAAVVDDFQHKLHHGDTQRAAQLLDASVLIFEGGNAEKSRAEYASHHLGADSEFLKKAQVVPLMRTGEANGNLAWIATESEITTQGAKPLSLVATETMVLEKTAGGWRVAHIHWSSREKK